LILISSFILVLIIEYTNVPYKIWEFSNWPLSEYHIGTLPVVMLMAWPTQFLVYFSSLRVFTSSNELDLW
jgi:hypothetical protein